VRDVTERKQVEEALQASEAALRRRNGQVRALAGKLIKAQEEERRSIARELHDGTAQQLFALTVNLARLAQTLPELDEKARSHLDECHALAEQSLHEVRTLSYVLRPPQLDRAGLLPALGWYVAGFVERSGIDVELAGPPDLGRLPAEVETTLFRIVQEGLTNIHRHSGSTCARITLTADLDSIVLVIEDRGHGLPPAATAAANGDPHLPGMGIISMRERLRPLGGQLTIQSSARGTIVSTTVPLSSGDGR
jgi:signal transduction histidine kinase